MQASFLILKHHGEFVALSSQLRYDSYSELENLIERIKDVVDDTKFWIRVDGWVNLGSGGLVGIFSIGGVAFGETAAKVADGLSRAVPFLTQMTRSEVEGLRVPLQTELDLLKGLKTNQKQGDEQHLQRLQDESNSAVQRVLASVEAANRSVSAAS